MKELENRNSPPRNRDCLQNLDQEQEKGLDLKETYGALNQKFWGKIWLTGPKPQNWDCSRRKQGRIWQPLVQ